ncbi:RNA-binding protein [Candidatus Gracilibacteria bacterium]|nr:RNA-binding protein [Candidatus Gracilibacteria bacterium]NJS40805.1 RNA-binding protein [Candidatus Gracilibacteria bacterium]
MQNNQNNLFVGNLSWNTTSEELEKFFSQVGNVESAKVVNDRESGRSRGFGFVKMTTADEAQAAIEQLDGAELDEREISVSPARDDNR